MIIGAGFEECLRGKLSNALMQLFNSFELNGQSTSAYELAGRMFGQDGDLSVGEMLSTSLSMLLMLESDMSSPD